MRSLKKLVSIILIACAIVVMLPASLEAAEPQLRFSDPSTTQGATFNVDATFYADDIGSVNATLTYDASALRFISGDNATDNGGQIQLTGSGNGNTQLTWTLQFQALQVTTTQIEIASVSASSSSGEALEVTRGSSTIAIGEGDPSLIQDDTASSTATGVQVDVNGTSYTVVDFSDILLPTGFTKSEVTLEGGQCPAALQESSGKYAVYLANGDGEENFFLYDPDDSSFSPFEQITISQDRFIIPLTKDVSSQMPDNLQETTFTVNGKEFPAWQNTDSESFYVLYALNSDGEEAFYQYDSADATYQRYTIDNTDEDEQSQTSSGLRRLFDILRDNIDRFLVGTWLVFLLFLIIIIILAVKLRHRNLELDDLYDEYGIDLDDEPEKVPEKKKKDKKADKKSKKQDKLAVDEESEFDDGFEEYEDDDFEDGFDSDEEDAYDLDGDDEDSYEEEEYDDEDFDEDYDAFVRGAKRSYDDVPRRSRRADDEEDIDDLDALLNARVREPAKRPKKTPERRSHAEEDDTFKMDIIDLD